jgi:hypothetical protein
MSGDIIIVDTDERNLLCVIQSSLIRNSTIINYNNNIDIIETFNHENFFDINDLDFNMDNIVRYFNNSFYTNFKLYIDFKILEYEPKHINKYVLTANVYIKPQYLHYFIMNEHINNTLEGNFIFDDINIIGEKYSFIYGSEFDKLSLLSYFIRQVNNISYGVIHSHNYLYNPINPYWNLNIHIGLQNFNIYNMFEALMIIERNMAIDKFYVNEQDDLINHKINEIKFYNKIIDICIDGCIKLSCNTIYNKIEDIYILIHNSDKNKNLTDDNSKKYIRRIIIKKNILIIKNPLLYYLLSLIKHVKDRFIIINYKDWIKLSSDSKLELIMTCFKDVTPVSESDTIFDYKKFSNNLTSHICNIVNGDNFMDITKIMNITTNLFNINASPSFYNIYDKYLNDVHNKETDIMILEYISCGNYFPTFNNISKNKELKSYINEYKKKKVECCICLENQYLNQMIITKCKHIFCKKDIIETFNESMNNYSSDKIYCNIKCPLCRETLEDRDIYNISKNEKMCDYTKKNILDYKTNYIYKHLSNLKNKNPDKPELHIIIGNTYRWCNSITTLIKNMNFNSNIIIKPLIWKLKFDFNTIDNIKIECFNNIKYSKIEYHIMNSSFYGDFYEQNYIKKLTNTIYFFNNIYNEFMDVIDDYNYISNMNNLPDIINNKKRILHDMISKSEKIDILFNYYVIKNTIDEKIYRKEIQFINHFKKSISLTNINNINNIPIIVHS